MASLANVLDLSRLVRGGLAVVATLLLAFLLAGAFVVATLTAALSALNPARPAGIGNGTSQAIPAEYRVMMERASAVSCGVPWRVLAAIGKVESDFTPNAVGPDLPQFAGTPDEHALGLMQFLPSTYRDLAPRVDAATGKALGEAGIWDAESAIFAAALYLCDNGAPGDLRAALYAYNHADWYVDQVLAQAASYGLGDTGNDAGAGPNGDVVTLARQYLGWPYVWGGADPATGFDCSGLVQWLYGQFGVALPRTAQAQFDATARLMPEQLQPGDLVFFAQTYADAANWITHVGLYVGDGQMINAPTEGEVVQTMPVFTGFWGEHYAGGGRARR